MPSSKLNRIILVLSVVIIIGLVLFAVLRDNADAITLKKAQDLLAKKAVERVVVTKEYVYLKTKKGYYKIASSQVTPRMFVDYKVEVGRESGIVLYIFWIVIFLALFSLVFRFLQKRGFVLFTPQIESQESDRLDAADTLGRSSAIEAMKSDVSFDDIGGISDVKVELEEIIDFLKNPKRYKDFGARLPRGVLLVGPPGVGKTMIAKAVANAADVPFYYQSGASFVQIYVGMGAKRVHELFAAAKKNAPAIVFIDEIDAVGKKRDGKRNDEREATLNQLLTEMDGFEGSSSVIVLAATNKIDVLDAALLRAGRFDRRIFVELPTKQERASILTKYLAKVPHDLDVNIIANMTVGFNGASLAALVNEAALLALRQKERLVTLAHFEAVKDKVMFGKKKLQILSEKQKAYRIRYQAGKVLVATYYDLAFEKLMLSNEKLTPATDEPYLQHELEARIKMLIAGSVACDMKYMEHASSAEADLKEAKELIEKMLHAYGMGSFLYPKEREEEQILKRLYEESAKLLASLDTVLTKIEAVLADRESIAKREVKEYLNAVL